ncbi:MAG: YIP1 family protein [Candidatus Eisenbacteria bacterium]|uniref:YIP1 family protein n=1 Tax=Eiseniibacteriota bacterium TaxID=2212470 RepID=A0A9D6L6A7_UNCEI|nr:YIP1 family protein [Candidatus Eisenbacteria bacterium]MBI3539576.1 YIP1 family protein [Candidatus Eisenbacteria bacterium]
MESPPNTPLTAPAPDAGAAAPNLSPFQRAIAIFARPTAAWSGLDTHAQWWFPLIIMIVFAACFSTVLHDRALMPMLSEQWEQSVADGKMTAQQVDKMEQMMGGPTGKAIAVVQQAVAWPIIMLISALLIWFGAGFVLGTKFRYRLALETVAWSSLITIPGQVLAGALMWSRETMKGIHTGFGILLPDDPSNKLLVGLGIFLDAIGPLSLWYLAVVIIGAAALSGAKRSSVAWVIGGIYIVLMLFFSVLGGMFSRGAGS